MADAALRLSVFLGLLLALAAAEALAPDRPDPANRGRRWPTNLALTVIGAGLARLLGPLSAVGAALWAQAHGVGLFHAVAAPVWLAAALSVVALDLALYAQHRVLHAVPVLWRLHAPHHADRHLDVTTGVRFHPGEIVVSAVWKAGVVAALGAPAAAVVAFEIALNAFSLFTHANWRLPGGVQRALGGVFITPRTHRLHHDRAAGRDSGNYGFSVTVWDRMFGTWREAPEPARLGIEGGPDDPARLGATLAQPLSSMD